MKNIEDLFFTVTKIRADAIFLSTARKQNVVHVRHTFVCRAVDTFCVEQMTFLKKVSSSRDSSRCISSSWPWLRKASLSVVIKIEGFFLTFLQKWFDQSTTLWGKYHKLKKVSFFQQCAWPQQDKVNNLDYFFYQNFFCEKLFCSEMTTCDFRPIACFSSATCVLHDNIKITFYCQRKNENTKTTNQTKRNFFSSVLWLIHMACRFLLCRRKMKLQLNC